MRLVNGNSKLHLFTVGREERNPRPRGEIRTDYNNIITIFILFAPFFSPSPVVRYYYLNNIVTILLCTDHIRLSDTALSTVLPAIFIINCFADTYYFSQYERYGGAAQIARRLRTRHRSSARTRSSIDNVARCLPTTDWTAKEAGACSTRRRSRRPPAHRTAV